MNQSLKKTTLFSTAAFLFLLPTLNTQASITQFKYDMSNGTKTITNPDNREIKYYYDIIDRLDKIELLDTSPPVVFDFDYREEIDGVLQELTDTIKEITYPDVDGNITRTKFSYDDFDRLAAIKDFDSVSDLLTFKYDHKDRLTRIGYPGNGQACYEYDGDGRLTRVGRIHSPDTTIKCFEADEITNYSFDTYGRLIKVSYPNDIERYIKYDAVTGQVKSFGYINANDGLIYSDSFKYIPGTKLYYSITRTTALEEKTTFYQYDAYERITQITEHNGRQTTFTYDPFGNRTEEKIVNIKDASSIAAPEQKAYGNYRYVFTPNSNRLNEIYLNDVLLESFIYDNNGRITSRSHSVDGDTTYTYEDRGYLTQVQKAGLIIDYTYDALGNRKSKTVNGETTYFLGAPIFGFQRTLLELSKDEATNDLLIKTSYVHAGSSVLKEEGFVLNRDTDLYYLNDGIVGSLTHAVDLNGEIKTGYEYDAFGTRTQTVSTAQDSNKHFGYTGEMFDDSTGLLYLRARYYDPKLGRFISADPFLGRLEQPVTQNRFIYVHNNPLLFVDPSGLASSYNNYPYQVYNSFVSNFFGNEINEIQQETDLLIEDYATQIGQTMHDPEFWKDNATWFNTAGTASLILGPEAIPAAAVLTGLGATSNYIASNLAQDTNQYYQESALDIMFMLFPQSYAVSVLTPPVMNYVIDYYEGPVKPCP